MMLREIKQIGVAVRRKQVVRTHGADRNLTQRNELLGLSVGCCNGSLPKHLQRIVSITHQQVVGPCFGYQLPRLS